MTSELTDDEVARLRRGASDIQFELSKSEALNVGRMLGRGVKRLLDEAERLRADLAAATRRAEEAEAEVNMANGVFVMTNEARPGERLDDAIRRLIESRIVASDEAEARGAARALLRIAEVAGMTSPPDEMAERLAEHVKATRDRCAELAREKVDLFAWLARQQQIFETYDEWRVEAATCEALLDDIRAGKHIGAAERGAGEGERR